MTRKKTYVLMLSEHFPASHPKAGKKTGFREKRDQGQKKHTIRGNADLWEHRANEINTGKAILSIRQWSGKPYGSGTRQIEIGQLERLTTQRVTLDFSAPWNHFISVPQENGETHFPLFYEVAENDGLTVDDFLSWFQGRKKGSAVFHGVILHFTDLIY